MYLLVIDGIPIASNPLTLEIHVTKRKWAVLWGPRICAIGIDVANTIKIEKIDSKEDQKELDAITRVAFLLEDFMPRG
jgi:hypothetical protein